MSEFDIGVVENNAYLGSLNITDLTDIYKFNLTTGGAFNVSLSGLTDNADLFLLNNNNQIIQSSTLSGNLSETLSFQNLSAGIYSLQITSSAGPTDYLLGIQTQETSTVEIDPLTGLPLTDNSLPSTDVPPERLYNFETGIFRVGETGIVNIDYLYDGGRFAGDFGLFNLAGMEVFTPGSTNYIKEAARRALTNSSLGYTVISDATEGAKFVGVFTPTETDFNTGTYQGIKTFAMNPGDTFGFILAPQDSLQTIFNNPALVGGRRPLFSMGTTNPNDTFYAGQITRVTDNNTAFVFEDTPVLNPGGSTDYNDLIFQIQGSTNIAPSLTDYVYGGRDWRNTSNGQQIVNFINTADTIPPTLQAALANDTGENNTDKITFDPTISGIVTDSKIFSLRARFNNTPIGSFTDIVSLINSDGTFSLNRHQLETIYGQSLPEGEHTLHLQAIDKYGAVSNTFNLSFTLEPEVIPVTDIGGIYQFNGQVINGTLRPRQSQQFTFNLRNSEITSTASDTVLISMSVAALSGSNFQPAVPTIQGLTPLVSQNNTNNSYALFAFNTAGQNTINLTGINSPTNGQYGLQLTVAGDINLDERVDATDAQLLNQALGITSNNPGYSLNLDINRDGVINNSDLELLNQNLGFVANTPAVITPANILTHQDLETTIDLGKFVSDADNDALTYSISNPINGTLETLNNGQTVVFKPSSNFAGVGSFDISVDDGGYEVSETINITVSDAPLINLEIIKSKKQLNVGETISLEVQGDFADAEDVVLPDSYLTYATENAEIAQISASGDVTASSEGTTILSVKRNNISAVTAIRAGQLKTPQNQSELNIAIAELYGLDSYPDAVTLPVGGTRQLLVGLNEVQESPDLKAAASGTRYFVSDSNILNVSADGQITALKEGFATVTIIYGTAEEIIPVRVGTEVTGPATVGVDGGIVKAENGSAVMIAPGALDENTTVSLTALNQAQLSLPIPEGFQFAGAINLEVGENALNVPAQLAIPAPVGIEAGTEVYFMRKGALPDETGTWNPIWLQEESGIVGDDGMIRTSSPPYPGVIRPGEYMVAYADITGSATLVKGQLTLNYNFPLAFFGIIDPRGNIGQLIEPENFVTIPAFTVTYDISSVKVIAIPKVGLPVITEVGVQRSTDGLATFETALNMPAPVDNDPTEPPILQKASLQFNDEFNNPWTGGEPVLFLTGSNVLVNNGSDPKGSRFEDLIVKFYVGDEVYEGTVLPQHSRNMGNNQFEVAVKVPNTVTLGDSYIFLSRKQNQLVDHNGIEPVYEEIQYNSNPIGLKTGAEYIFAALRNADRVAVLDGSDPESVVENGNSNDLQLASIPVGTDNITDRPRELAITSDATRVYVLLEGSSRVALVDALTLQQVDTNPDTPEVNPINLPTGASPQSIVIDSRDEYAYIADGLNGNLYILDIDPFSTTYHQIVQTIALTPTPVGLRQMAISSDGRKLFVTATNNQIIVVNIDFEDKPLESHQNSRKWREVIGMITTALGTEGIAATHDPLKMTFTCRLSDFQGFGVLEITNNDPTNFAATTRYVSFGLGSAFDYFDVNRAVAVTVMRDGSYAFVAAKNDSLVTDVESVDGVQAGSNIAIIKDPLGTNPQLVAATRPIPQGFTTDLVLSNDDKSLYASYPTLSGGGGVYVFDVEEIIKTLDNPGNYQIDSLDRGKGSTFFNAATARNATVSDFARVPIDDINPAISIAADYEIIAENRPANQFTYGVPSDTTRGPIATGGSPWGLSASPVITETPREEVQEISRKIANDIRRRNTTDNEAEKERIDRSIARHQNERKLALLEVVQEEQADNGVIEPIDGEKGIYKITQGEDLDQIFYGTTSVIWKLAPVSASVFSIGEDIAAQPTNLPPGTTLNTPLGVGGSTIQGRIQPYPGDIDFSEQFEIKAPNSDSAAKAAANTIIEFVRRTRNNPIFEFQRIYISTLNDEDEEGNLKKSWSFEEITSPNKYILLIDALKNLNSRTGNINTFWRAKVDENRFINISKILDITAKKSTTGEELFSTRQTIGKEELLLSQEITEEEDFFLTRLGGAEYQTAYIDKPEKIPSEKLGAYASLMRSSALKLADQKGKYLKAAKRAFNYFMSIGNIEAMEAVKPVFESPYARVNQEVAVMEAIQSALDPEKGVQTLILQVGEARNMLNNAAEIIENRLSAVDIANELKNLATGLPGNPSDLLQQNGERSDTLAGLVSQTETLINQGLRAQVESIIQTYLRNYYQP